MTEVIRRHRWKLVVLAGLAVATWIVAAGLRAGSASDAAPREVTLEMRGIAFHSPEQPGRANPALELERGRAVRLTLVNQEPGAVLHCFTVPGLEVKTTRSLATGESEVVEFVPRRAGTYAYACLLHPGMTGKVVVR